MKCLRIYSDETGESHLADIDIPLVPTEVFPDVPALDLSDQYTATSVRFAWVPSGIREAGWHTTPVRQLVVWLTGWVEFETSDGETRRCEPGAVVLAEDTFGKGHVPEPSGQSRYRVDARQGNSQHRAEGARHQVRIAQRGEPDGHRRPHRQRQCFRRDREPRGKIADFD